MPYIIRKGDTLVQIASLYQANVSDIIRLNPNINPENLSIGTQICVPLSIQLYPSCPTSNYYVVKKDDNFSSIADYFNVSTALLYYSNYGINPDDLYEDQVLCIPVAPPPVKLVVNINNRILEVKKDDEVIRSYRISKTAPDYPIFRGKYIILNKKVDPGEKFGARWLGLSKPGFGIHGINTPQFIQAVATENNIILTDKDITELFNLVTVGTQVTIF